MTEFNIILSRSFNDDLENIFSYIFYLLKEPYTAINFKHKVASKIASLKYFPNRYSKILIHNNQYRKLPVGNFIIIYDVDPFKNQVIILHIYHGSQNTFTLYK
ncbi:MAG: type II toxin-antitoxin system RelE/ParE family toxin [Clostridia bacterium]|nr:type II toxin-antitoxin system RelE/ParE family toxin [Clostridia bacterium]